MSTRSLVKQISDLSDFFFKLVLENHLLWIIFFVDGRMTYFLAWILTSFLISLLRHSLVNRAKMWNSILEPNTQLLLSQLPLGSWLLGLQTL